MKTFQELILRQFLDAKRARYDSPSEPMADIAYSKELKLKQKALAEFWAMHNLDKLPKTIIPSPAPRNYRSTSKRKVREVKGRFELFNGTGNENLGVWTSNLEPQTHETVYRWVHQWINEDRNQFLARRLNWVILRGHDSNRLHLIFNLTKLDGSAMKAFKAIAIRIPEELKLVIGASIYVDPSMSDYYFESNSIDSVKALKPLFGQPFLDHEIGDFKWRFPVTGFSQVNQECMKDFVDTASEMLKPSLQYDLIDLYCGYGFFSLTLGQFCRQSIGIDWAGASIEMARKNLQYQKVPNIRLLSREITQRQIDDLAPPRNPELILLDPPRSGTAKGVIESIAQRFPDRVLHIFCGIETLPKAVRDWENAGYELKKWNAIDLFPGTTSVEILGLFEPKK